MQDGLLKDGDLVVTNDKKHLKQVYIVGGVRQCTVKKGLPVEQALLLKQIAPDKIIREQWFPVSMLDRPTADNLKTHDYKMRNLDDQDFQKAAKAV